MLSIALTAAPAAEAKTSREYYTEVYTDFLVDQGFYHIRISRTFLGRIRLVAESSDMVREMIINPYTGEVLRDVIRPLIGSVQASSGGSGVSPNRGTDDDDAHDDNSGSGSDDDEIEHDNSGSGSDSDNSGSGSDSDNSGSGSDSDNSGSGSDSENSGSGSYKSDDD